MSGIAAQSPDAARRIGEPGHTERAIEEHLRVLAPLVLSKLRTAIGRRDELDVSTKHGAFDLVTDADRSIESWLFEETKRSFPDDGFLGEEGGRRLAPRTETDWIVDPIDGTVNFVSGLPWSCCSIGAVVSGAPAGGLIVDPFRGDVYLTAPSLRASELNGAPMAVAAGGDLAGRLVLLELPSGAMPSALGPVEAHVRGEDGSVRSMGSGALALAMVAAGRVQAVVHRQPNIWDIAAGVALVNDAGGVVLGRDGAYVLGQPGPLVAGNPQVCERLHPLVKAY